VVSCIGVAGGGDDVGVVVVVGVGDGWQSWWVEIQAKLLPYSCTTAGVMLERGNERCFLCLFKRLKYGLYCIIVCLKWAA